MWNARMAATQKLVAASAAALMMASSWIVLWRMEDGGFLDCMVDSRHLLLIARQMTP